MEFTPKQLTFFLITTMFFSLLQSSSNLNSINNSSIDRIHVGVIVDIQSWVGKIVDSCISMAISDFYNLDSGYKTKLVPHTINSRSDPLLALSQALILLENVKLHAIILVDNSAAVKILAELGSRAEIPIISLFAVAPSFSFSQYPYLIQIGQDESLQAKGIAAILEAFSWKDIILIHEDNDSAREMLSKMIISLEGSDIRLAQHIAILASSSDEEIIEQLQKLKSLQTTVYVVHMSPFLASRLFLNAKQLGMISQGYAWITTDMIMNFLYSMEPLVVKSMQGVLGFKPHIPASEELHKFTLRWRRKNFVQTQNLQEILELNAYGLWTYDMVWALAAAAERVKTRHPDIIDRETSLNMNFTTVLSSQSGYVFTDEILKSRFKGISGGLQLTNGRLTPKEFEIVNVFKGERIVGCWSPENGITTTMKQDEHNEMHSTSSSKLEGVTWPGGIMNIPKGWSLRDKKLRIGVPVSGFSELIKVIIDPQTNETTVTGFCVDVFEEAIARLDYKVHYEFIPFVNANGEMTGSYNDLIRQVYLKNYDAAVGDITIIASRFSYVDFTLTYTDLGVGMVVPKTNKNSMWIFLKPLARDLWIMVAAFFIFTGFVVWLIEHPINEEFQGTPAKQIGMIFWYSFSTLVFAHKEKLLSNLSKFVVLIWVFVVLILSSSYTATLASMLTVQQIQLTSREDYIGYHSGILLPRAVSNLNYENPRLKPYQSPEQYADALARGSKNGGVSAIIDEIPYIKVFLAKYSADYAMIKPEYSTSSGFGFAFPKGSPLVRDISSAIVKIREEGKLQLMENAWFNGQSSFTSQQDSTDSNPSSLNLHSFGGLFLVTGMSSTSALLICLYQKRQSMTIGNLKFCLNRSLDSVKGSFNMFSKIIYDKYINFYHWVTLKRL